MNYFGSSTTAERYAKGRPYNHPLVVERLRKSGRLQLPVQSALDVGCGTGLSCVALKEIAASVIGVDTAREMLARAPICDGVEYIEANAEELPFPDAFFDLITVGSALHWFDYERFLKEAYRLLRPGGFLIVYENFWLMAMEDIPEFSAWVRSRFFDRYPTPPRNRRNIEPVALSEFGLQWLAKEEFEVWVPMTAPRLVDYLLTMTNLIAVVESGRETVEEAEAWLLAELELFHANRDAERRNRFGGFIEYVAKSD